MAHRRAPVPESIDHCETEEDFASLLQDPHLTQHVNPHLIEESGDEAFAHTREDPEYF